MKMGGTIIRTYCESDCYFVFDVHTWACAEVCGYPNTITLGRAPKCEDIPESRDTLVR